MVNRRAFVLAALALSGCASAGVRVMAPPNSGFSELEPLYGADVGRDAITIAVASNGCTAKADFAHYVERRGEAVTLAFGRKRLDTCKSFAMGRTDLTFTWAELSLPRRGQVFLLNPLTAWTGPGS